MIGDGARMKAVIFDLDDTLISEGEYIKSGYQHIAELLSQRTSENVNTIFNMLMNLFHESPKNVFNRLLHEIEIHHTKDDIMELVEAYRNHMPKIKFYDDVLICLEQLKAKDIKTGIITDGYISPQRNKLKVLGADKYFDHIIVTDELGREYWKPHPKAFELMRNVLRVEYNEMVYIGDNPEKDFYISNIHPIKTVRICRETAVYEEKEYYRNVKENICVYSLGNIEELC